jgi:hypothetical protein
MPPKGPTAAAAKKGGPTAAELAVAAAAVKAEPGRAVKAGANGQQQQSSLLKQEVKQEQRISRNNSDLTLGISADQEANVGLCRSSSWTLRTACGGCDAQLAVWLAVGVIVCSGVSGNATDCTAAAQLLAALLPVMMFIQNTQETMIVSVATDSDMAIAMCDVLCGA